MRDIFAWCLALLPPPLLAAAILHDSLIETASLTHVVIAALDMLMLRKTGLPAPSAWYVFVYPAYLWKRSALLHQRQWIFSASILVLAGLGIGTPQLEKASLSHQICDLVTQAVQKDLQSPAECKKFDIEHSLPASVHLGVATMNDGVLLPALARIKNDYIEVYTSPFTEECLQSYDCVLCNAGLCQK
jgi:hypothetical protein